MIYWFDLIFSSPPHCVKPYKRSWDLSVLKPCCKTSVMDTVKHRAGLNRDVLVYSSGHGSTADPDKDQDREDQSGGQDPAWKPWVPGESIQAVETQSFKC
ncbi:hypothetical protein JZ751_014269 [Albula glossodonta]|uniref:Uncharacterized protein n=1 Tax=Albula glossodonta TaxID=121402 RepID=A0A8T2P0W7_9TELE|nr:hypothetical protein JZ751_014269 [Albula glossodonta]